MKTLIAQMLTLFACTAAYAGSGIDPHTELKNLPFRTKTCSLVVMNTPIDVPRGAKYGQAGDVFLMVKNVSNVVHRDLAVGRKMVIFFLDYPSSIFLRKDDGIVTGDGIESVQMGRDWGVSPFYDTPRAMTVEQFESASRDASGVQGLSIECNDDVIVNF